MLGWGVAVGAVCFRLLVARERCAEQTRKAGRLAETLKDKVVMGTLLARGVSASINRRAPRALALQGW